MLKGCDKLTFRLAANRFFQGFFRWLSVWFVVRSRQTTTLLWSSRRSNGTTIFLIRIALPFDVDSGKDHWRELIYASSACSGRSTMYLQPYKLSLKFSKTSHWDVRQRKNIPPSPNSSIKVIWKPSAKTSEITSSKIKYCPHWVPYCLDCDIINAWGDNL
jgi:hypothetical protein